MKITIESYGKKYSTEVEHDDVTITECIDYMVNLLVCVGFAKETIIDNLKQIEE